MPKNTANAITIARIILVPVYLFCAYHGWEIAAFLVFVIASLSDFADGYIARHFNQVSDFGKFADPLADKMLVLSVMCFFIENGQMPGWCVAVVIMREFAVSGLRLIAVEKGRVIAAAWSGKIKTACTMVGLAAMLLFPDVEWLNVTVTVIIVATTLYSGVEYFVKNRAVFASGRR